MCFGPTETGSKTTQSTANPAVSGAATSNLKFAQNLQQQGPTAYTGQMVAPISGQQHESFGMADTIGADPAWNTAAGYINNAATAGPSSVNASTIASKMDPYMNQYVMQALAPQLEQQRQQFDTQNRGAASNSTMAGAFGNDSQDALYRSNLTNEQNIARTGLIGNAYNNAFNTAIGAGAQDVSNNLNAQTTNANLNETALQREAAGATGLENLQAGREGATSLVNQMGQQQTAQSQAEDNAKYQEFLRQQQQPYLSTELLNQTIGAGSQAMPASTTATEYKPDNSGMQAAGTAAAMGAMMFLADGGDLGAGQPAVVGERGPELVVPRIASDTPNAMPAVAAPQANAMPQIAMMPAAPQPGQQQQPQQQQQQDPNATAGGAFMNGFNHPLSLPSMGSAPGAGATAGVTDPTASLSDSFGLTDPTMMMGFAAGGSPPVGRPSIVGENGPEVIVPKHPITVIPNHQLTKKPAPKKRDTTAPLAEQMGLAA
jgi:hypothetical protein